jgi:hypothetical protein
MEITAIILRFIIGVVLTASMVVSLGLPPIASITCILTVGVMAGIWGDKFLLGFMSLMRYFR